MNAIYQRLKLERNGKPVWRYQSVEEGRGKRTGRLTGPFYIRPTVRSNGTATQAWVKLTADNFDEAKAEAGQRGAAFDAAAKGLTVAEAEAVSNAGRNPIKVAIEKFLEKKRKRAIFSKATPEEWVRYQFFLDSACREKEVAVAEWSDIDWTRGLTMFTRRPGYQTAPVKRKDSQ